MINTKSMQSKSGKARSKKTMTGQMWRLVHDGTTAFAIIEGSNKSKTETILDVLEFNTESEALAEIKKLGLKYESEVA